MPETVQEYKEEVARESARRKLFADVKKKEKIETKKARLKIFEGGVIGKLTKKQPRTGAGAGRVLRKAVAMASGSEYSISKKGGKGSGRGRGRPKGTYRTRVLPSGRVVKVPTHIYKKMLSAENTQMRLAAAQRQQYAEQLAMGQDPRFQQPVTEDQFLAEPDPYHELEVARAQAGEPIYVQEPSQPFQKIPGKLAQFGRGISKLGGGLRRPQEQVVDAYGRQIQPQYPQRTQRPALIREPNVSVWRADNNILNTPNIFNNPGTAELIPQGRRKL